jgi:diguanylate cyclase (GGDEF)-like protein/PAS domain S-box-containing protein
MSLRDRLASLSLRAKLSMAGAGLVLLAVTAFSVLAWRLLAVDVRRGIADAQQALVSATARELDEKVQVRREALVMAAAVLGQQDGLPGAAELETHFASRPTVRGLFDVLFVADASGRMVYDSPYLPGRRGSNIAERDFFRQVMAEGEPLISRPFIARSTRQPSLAFAVPLRGRDGRMVGLLGGVMLLDRPNFLTQVGEQHVGQDGHLLLLDKRGGEPLVLMHPKADRLMSAPRALLGDALVRDMMSRPDGAQEAALSGPDASLVTWQSLEQVGWTLAAVYPASEAYAGLQLRERAVLGAGAVVALLAGGALWLFVGRLLRPLQALRLAMNAHGVEGLEAGAPEMAGGSQELTALARAYARARERQLESESALRASEARLRTIADSLPATIAYLDEEERYRFTNAQYQVLYGLDPQAMIGRTPRELFGEQVYANLAKSLDAARRGERLRFESRVQIGGHDRWMSFEYVPDLVAGRLQGFYVMAQDVTAQKRSQALLRESEQRLRTITDHTPALISHLDAGLRYRFVNNTMAEWTGLSARDVIGRTMVEAFGLELYESRREQLERALAGEQVEFEIELTMRGVRRVLRSVYVPDRAPDGQVVGVYTMGFDVTALKDVEQQLQALARFDPLTGLPNRRQCEERLAEAMARCRRTGRPMAVMFMDLDRFKAINDELGHGGGDAVLREFARRLSASVRGTDTAARLAGDEFVAILEGLNTGEEAQVVARKLVAAVRRPFDVDGQPVAASTSIGIAYYDGESVLSPEELLARADRALYEVKNAGRDAWRLVAC